MQATPRIEGFGALGQDTVNRLSALMNNEGLRLEWDATLKGLIVCGPHDLTEVNIMDASSIVIRLVPLEDRLALFGSAREEMPLSKFPKKELAQAVATFLKEWSDDPDA